MSLVSVVCFLKPCSIEKKNYLPIWKLDTSAFDKQIVVIDDLTVLLLFFIYCVCPWKAVFILSGLSQLDYTCSEGRSAGLTGAVVSSGRDA